MDFEEKRRLQNSENSKKGLVFELRCQKILDEHFNMKFEHQVKIEIGNPPKGHVFDLASSDKKIICECKYYTWTSTGNYPSAKMTTIDQAVWYFSFLENCECIVLVRKSLHAKRRTTLAENYVKSKKHLLRGVHIWEIDDTDNRITKLT